MAGKDVTYSLDVLPQEYPTLGTGDYRAHALNIADAEGVECCNLTFRDYEISKGKYTLPGLPAVWAAEDEADTLKITLRDETGIVEVQLMYGVLEKRTSSLELSSLKIQEGEMLPSKSGSSGTGFCQR